MDNITLDDCPNKHASQMPTTITIYGPTWVDNYPYSEALRSDLNRYGWRTWLDKLGRLCAAHVALFPEAGHA
jgi:hypothetical protein